MNYLVIFGGIGKGNKVLSDIHLLNLDKLEWIEPLYGVDGIEQGVSGDGPTAPGCKLFCVDVKVYMSYILIEWLILIVYGHNAFATIDSNSINNGTFQNQEGFQPNKTQLIILGGTTNGSNVSHL